MSRKDVLWEGDIVFDATKSITSSVSKVLAQSCPTLCDPMDCSPPGTSVHGILQAKIEE